MKLTALPVNVGDSFLLKVSERYILVDGGQNRSHIVKLLDSENIESNHIHIIICTHYDSDHIEGIIGILKSNKYSFDEIWLPEILGSLSYTLTEKLWEILDYLRSRDEPIHELSDIEDLELPYKEYDELRSESISLSSLNFLLNSSNVFRFRSVIPGLSVKLGANLYSACTLVSGSLSSGAHVRWFRYMGSLVDFNCGYNMVAKNAIETGITVYSTPATFFQALSLSIKNKESHVFLYDDEKLPNVLFTADSDLSFTAAPISLASKSMVTAPHHGSEHNKGAYAKIHGDNLYFVRSDRSQTKRPCSEYIAQANKYCTICRNRGPKQKVVLELVGNSVSTQANKCSC